VENVVNRIKQGKAAYDIAMRDMEKNIADVEVYVSK
jgi:hypothetical protein